MAFTSFEEFENIFAKSVQHGEVDCGKIGKLTVREPSAVVFEPIDARRRLLLERAALDVDCEEDRKLIPPDMLEKPKEEWPGFSYLKFSPADRGEWFSCCADVIAATVTNGNGKLLFAGHEDQVKTWPGGLLTQVSDDIIAFVRGGEQEEKENPT